MRIAILTSIALTAIGSWLDQGCLAETIRFEGASTGSAIAKIAVEEYRRSKKGTVTFVTGTIGSGAGLRKLCENALDIANTERPILQEEMATCRKASADFVELPIAFDSVAVVVNRRNRFVNGLTARELRAMWEEAAQGKIVRWSQVNPGFPDAPLKLLGQDRKYEQTTVFTETILGRGKSPRRDYIASVDEHILIQAVARDVYTLAYVSYASYLDNREQLRAVPVFSDAGRATMRSTEERANGAELSFARPLFLYVNAQSLIRPPVREFLEFLVANGAPIAKAVNYEPLPAAAYRLALARLRGGAKGSAWDGAVPVGATPADVQRRLASP